MCTSGRFPAFERPLSSRPTGGSASEPPVLPSWGWLRGARGGFRPRLDHSPPALNLLVSGHLQPKEGAPASSRYIMREDLLVAALLVALLPTVPSRAQVATMAPASAESKRIQNIPPNEMWKRVKVCVFPTDSAAVSATQVTEAVELGLGISPRGEVANHRALAGQASALPEQQRRLLVQSAVDAIRQWKFTPNVVNGETTWSRVRALVRFNADGTTAVDLAPAILADDFGDSGMPTTSPPGKMASAAEAVPKPPSSPECRSAQPWTAPSAPLQSNAPATSATAPSGGPANLSADAPSATPGLAAAAPSAPSLRAPTNASAQAREIEVSEVGPGFYKNNYFGLTFHFPSAWQVADRAFLDSTTAQLEKAGQSRYAALAAPNVNLVAFPSYTLFFARTDGPIDSLGSSVRIWAENWLVISSADQYFPSAQWLYDRSADGTRGPEEMEIGGRTFYRADRWGKVYNRNTYQVRAVIFARDLILAVDVDADSATTAEQLVKSLAGLSFDPAP